MSEPDPRAVFQAEAQELLVQLEEALLQLEERPEARELIDTAFRALHTLKGSGGMFGTAALAGFAHHVESTFEGVRRGEVAAGKGLIGLMLRATDHLRHLLEAPERVEEAETEALVAALAQASAARPSQPPPVAAARTFRIRLRLAETALQFGTNPIGLLDELRALGECTVVARREAIPPLEAIEPTLCYLGWDIVFTTGQPRSAIEDVFIFVRDDAEISIEELPAGADVPVPRLGELLVGQGDAAPEQVERAAAAQRPIGAILVQEEGIVPDAVKSALAVQAHLAAKHPAAEPAGGGGSIRINAGRLDALMDQVGELVIAQARLAQLAGARQDPALSAVAEEIERLAAELRDSTMAMRMLPVGTLFGRFRRVVHDLSAELGKEVALTMAGEDTELDKTVIERLSDPLVHLIRNAVDHGIEDTVHREAAGKPRQGAIHLDARQSGAEVLIAIRDDGAGLDRARMRERAVAKGLIAPNAELTPHELDQLLFLPGFSTAKAVTSVSGRGVGMDVVKRTIEGLRGTVEIASIPGRGTTVTLRLPLTLAIIDGLLVRVGRGMFVIPLAAVEECVELGATLSRGSDGRSFLDIRGSLVPFLRLHDLFRMPARSDEPMVVIVGADGGRIGLVVDGVIGQHQTVIKSLSRLHRDIPCLAGATILGDGRVALIVDVPPLLQLAQVPEQRPIAA